MTKDFLDEIIAQGTEEDASFPAMVEAQLRARRLVHSLVERRRALGLSQTLVAARMGTSQSALARLEAGDSDPRLSTVERFAEAVGEELAHSSSAKRRAARSKRLPRPERQLNG